MNSKEPFVSNLGPLGDGSYGDVFKAKINKTNEIVAIKRNFVSREASFLGAVKEIDFLTRLRNHPNIIKIKNIYLKSPFNENDLPKLKINEFSRIDVVYFSMELGIRDGHSVMVDSRVSLKSRKKIFLDLLLGLEYIHSRNIIHRDIKPSNFVQFKENGNFIYKWCDFGLSLSHSPQDQAEVKGVVNYGFRAPEIAFKNKHYDTRSDMWSMGCLMIEIFTQGKSTFIDDRDLPSYAKKVLKSDHTPNVKNKDLIKLILKKITPIPTEQEIKQFDKKMRITKKLKEKRPDLENILGFENEQIEKFDQSEGKFIQFLDLLYKLMTLDPKKRYSATEALNHEFFNFGREIIRETRTKSPCVKNIPNLSIINCPARKAACDYFKDFFSEKNDYFWHRERVMFHSLRIFDQFLVYNDGEIPDSKENLDMYIKICLYLCVKLFIPEYYLMPFRDFFGGGSIDAVKRETLGKIESYLVSDVLSGELYSDSLLEMANIEGDKLSLENKNNLFGFYGNYKNVKDKNVLEIYKEWKAGAGKLEKL